MMTVLRPVNRLGPRDLRMLRVRIAPHKRQPVLKQGPEGRDVDLDIDFGVSFDALLCAADLWRPIRNPECMRGME